MELKRFLENQSQKMQEYKWLLGEELGCDPGDEAIEEWVHKFAASYRKEYNEVYEHMIMLTAQQCLQKLKDRLPGVSDELWGLIFKTVIDEFTSLWTKELVLKDENTQQHLKEI